MLNLNVFVLEHLALGVSIATEVLNSPSHIWVLVDHFLNHFLL